MLRNGLAHSKVWHIVDGRDKLLGRLAQRIGIALRGKYSAGNKEQDCGDYVVVNFAGDFAVTGNKRTDKEYVWHTGYPGGKKTKTLERLMDRNPLAPLKKAVYGVLPKNNLRRVWMSRLYLFRDDNHAYAANALQDHEGASVPAVCISQVSKKDQQGSPADLPNNQ